MQSIRSRWSSHSVRRARRYHRQRRDRVPNAGECLRIVGRGPRHRRTRSTLRVLVVRHLSRMRICPYMLWASELIRAGDISSCLVSAPRIAKAPAPLEDFQTASAFTPSGNSFRCRSESRHAGLTENVGEERCCLCCISHRVRRRGCGYLPLKWIRLCFYARRSNMLPHALEQCREQCRGIREGKLEDLARRVHSRAFVRA